MGTVNSSKNQALLLSTKIFFLIFFFFSYKMKMSYLFLIVAGVIALGAVTAALEIEVVKRDIAAPEDESKSLAEDPAGEASSLAQLTRREAEVLKRMQLGRQKALRLNAPQLDKLGEGYIGKTMDMPLPDIDSDHQTKVLKRMQLGRQKALRLNAPQLDKLGEGYIGKTMDMPLPDIDSDHQTKAL